MRRIVTSSSGNLVGQSPAMLPTLYRPPIGGADRTTTGYRGRSGIYELIGFDDRLRELVHDGASEQVMLEHVRRRTPGILQDGWEKVVSGVTSVEEVLRVTRQE